MAFSNRLLCRFALNCNRLENQDSLFGILRVAFVRLSESAVC